MFKSLKTRFFTQYHLFVFIVIFALKNPRNPCGLWDFTDVIYFGRHHGCDTGVRYASLFFDRCCGSRKKRSLPTPRGKISFFLRFDEPLSLHESGVLKSPYRSLKKNGHTRFGMSVFGCDTGIRTPTSRVRGCCATFTLYRNTSPVYQAFILYYILKICQGV